MEKFDPSFTLFKKDESSPNGFKMIEKYKLVDGKIILDNGLGVIYPGKLKDVRGHWITHYFINEDYLLLTKKSGDKWYSAKFNIKDEEKSDIFDLEVNHPVSYKKWRFYLMSYGQDRQGDYVVLTARKDPGRIAVITGIWMLMSGIFMMCFLRKK